MEEDGLHDMKTRRLLGQMHKAISIIQFKLEAALIDRHPEWGMDDRKLLHRIDFERGVFVLDGKDYPMKDASMPTVDPANPYRLTAEEANLVAKLHHSFLVSDKLQKHINILFTYGCMYGIYNSNLLFHASVPLNADGTLKEVEIRGHKYRGRELLHKIGMVVREAYNADTEEEERSFARDYIWYLWCGPDSPLFDKSKMATFERYFVDDKSLYVEEKGNYYKLRDDEHVCDMILDAFGVKGPNRHIINGHVPVHAMSGESPIKANGKLMVIDGGFSKAFHDTTGIAGYTLVFHSRGFQLVQHEPFASTAEAIRNGTDIKSTTQIVEMSSQRMMVKDTDKGAELMKQVEELNELLYAYRHGYLTEKVK
jgi:fructose-1,6-bisphosphatase-3